MRQDKDPVFAGDYALVPKENYEAIVIKHEKKKLYKREKLYLWFQIISGPHQGTQVFMPFNFADRILKSHKYYKAWVLAKGGKPKKNDRMSPRIFNNKVFLIKIKTVQYDAKQQALPIEGVYSVVEEILEICAGA